MPFSAGDLANARANLNRAPPGTDEKQLSHRTSLLDEIKKGKPKLRRVADSPAPLPPLSAISPSQQDSLASTLALAIKQRRRDLHQTASSQADDDDEWSD